MTARSASSTASGTAAARCPEPRRADFHPPRMGSTPKSAEHKWGDPALFGFSNRQGGVALTTHETGHDTASSEGTVTVTETGSGTYTQQITAGAQQLVADGPGAGGADTG